MRRLPGGVRRFGEAKAEVTPGGTELPVRQAVLALPAAGQSEPSVRSTKTRRCSDCGANLQRTPITPQGEGEDLALRLGPACLLIMRLRATHGSRGGAGNSTRSPGDLVPALPAGSPDRLLYLIKRMAGTVVANDAVPATADAAGR
ncbi:hypothetical protein ACFXGA_18660 [Actinosynnema sp. NPDC059335]|uniref:hypothetical protein n=1 Tax=Actinosynnema sp. NPDC059335 TaxID=3346804 RepID=UPI0036735713